MTARKQWKKKKKVGHLSNSDSDSAVTGNINESLNKDNESTRPSEKTRPKTCEEDRNSTSEQISHSSNSFLSRYQGHKRVAELNSMKTAEGFQNPFYNPMERTEKDKDELKRRLHDRIWVAITKQDWNSWEQLFGIFKERALHYDEVSYILLMWGYVLSHRHRSENAYLVLEEMRRSGFVNGVLLRYNESLLNSYFELAELNARPEPFAWQNVVRLAIHAAQRYQKKRVSKMELYLKSLNPDVVMQLTPLDVHNAYLEEIKKSQVPMLGISGGYDGVPRHSLVDSAAVDPNLSIASRPIEHIIADLRKSRTREMLTEGQNKNSEEVLALESGDSAGSRHDSGDAIGTDFRKNFNAAGEIQQDHRGLNTNSAHNYDVFDPSGVSNQITNQKGSIAAALQSQSANLQKKPKKIQNQNGVTVTLHSPNPDTIDQSQHPEETAAVLHDLEGYVGTFESDAFTDAARREMSVFNFGHGDEENSGLFDDEDDMDEEKYLEDEEGDDDDDDFDSNPSSAMRRNRFPTFDDDVFR